MSNFIVDTPLLACPDPDSFCPADFQVYFFDFLSRLSDLSWLRANLSSVIFWRNSDLSVLLHQQGCYPFRHTLARAFDRLPDSLEFQLEDINVLATALLERSLVVEDEGLVRDIIVSGCVLENDPVPNRSGVLVEGLCKTLALALPILGDGSVFSENTYVASCGLGSGIEHITATYKIELLEYSDGACCDCDFDVAVRIPNYRGVKSFLKEANLAAWWVAQRDKSIMDVCLINAVMTQNGSLELVRELRPKLTIGRDFVLSADRLGFMHDKKKICRLVRDCGDLLLGRNLAKSHILREGVGANEPQKLRGVWRAWRHDIDDEFHLHYWRNGSRIELANVVVHNDFDISS